MSSWKGWRLTAAGARLQTKVEAGEPLVLKEIAVAAMLGKIILQIIQPLKSLNSVYRLAEKKLLTRAL